MAAPAELSVRVVACNMGASEPENFTAPEKWHKFNAKVTRSKNNKKIVFVNNLINVAFFVPSQVQSDLEKFAQHGVGLVFFCEPHEAHHKQVQLPHGWRKSGSTSS